MEPCYKKFTLILAKKAKQSITKSVQRSSARLVTPACDSCIPARDSEKKKVYPNICNYCKKYQLKHKRKIQFPKSITTSDAVATIKAAAKQNNPDLYYEINDLDLIAREFKYHKKCYNDINRGFAFKARIESSEKAECLLTEPASYSYPHTHNYHDLDAVKRCIEQKILLEKQVISIRTLHEIYDIQEASEPSSECSRTRNKLKKKIVSLYGEKLVFLTSRVNTPEIVISAATIDTQVVVSDKESSIMKVANYLR